MKTSSSNSNTFTSKRLDDFLKQYKAEKGSTITNTRIGSKDLNMYSDELKTIENEITLFHAKVANIMIKKNTDWEPDIIGFHGQTIFHNSNEKLSVHNAASHDHTTSSIDWPESPPPLPLLLPLAPLEPPPPTVPPPPCPSPCPSPLPPPHRQNVAPLASSPAPVFIPALPPVLRALGAFRNRSTNLLVWGRNGT